MTDQQFDIKKHQVYSTAWPSGLFKFTIFPVTRMAFSPATYLKNSWVELKKVTWPTRQEAIRSTGVVIVFSVIVALFLGVLDYLFTLGLNFVIDQLNK